MEKYEIKKDTGCIIIIGIIIILTLLLTCLCLSCSKPQFGFYTIPHNTSMIIPPINFETDTLKCRVKFHYNCMNTPDWNKLFLYGGTVSFIWKGEGNNIALGWCVGIYNDYSTETYGRFKTIHPEQWYELMIIPGEKTSWYINGKFAASYSCVNILSSTVSSGEVNGFVDYDMSYEMYFN